MGGFVRFSPDFGKTAGTPTRGGGGAALLGGWMGVVHGLRHTVTHEGALMKSIFLFLQ